MASVEQNVQTLLEKYPGLRCSTNRLVFGYWIHYDHLNDNKGFDVTTPLESIVREARKVFARRPDLSPAANPLRSDTEDLFLSVFPSSVRVDAPSGV